MGSLSCSIVHPREVYKAAILANAASFCFLHNHPSGSTEPSIDDIVITNRLCKVGSILRINVLDYLIRFRFNGNPIVTSAKVRNKDG